VYVDGAIPYDDLITPYLVQDLIAQKDPARSGSQEVQQLEFLFGQGNVLAVYRHFEFGRIDAQVLYFQDPFFRLLVDPAEQRIYTANEYFWTDGFGDIVVGARLQAPDVRALIAEGGEDRIRVSLKAG